MGITHGWTSAATPDGSDVTPTNMNDHTIANDTVTEAQLSIADNTTKNVSTSAHGFVPKAPNDTTKFLRGDAAWEVPGITHAYVGYNTVGGSSEGVVMNRQYMKKITLASACMMTSIGVYLKQATTGTTVNVGVGVLTDNSGSPELLIAHGASGYQADGQFLSTTNSPAGAARWFHVPLGLYLAAGDYWLAVVISVINNNEYSIYYDGSGSDRYFTNNAGGRMSDSGWTTVTTSSNSYSIRASTIS